MKPIAIHIPVQSRNEYLEKMYMASLMQWLDDQGAKYGCPSDGDLDRVVGCTLLINGDCLKPEQIIRLRERNNTLVSFDINDSSWLTDAYRFAPEIEQIDLIFKVAGIQKANVNKDVRIDENFQFNLYDRTFLPDDAWERYARMRDTGRLLSLPYVPWHCVDAPKRSFAERSGKVLIRGGNHFWRFMVYLQLLKAGMADERCSFPTADYFRNDMDPQFMYCPLCRHGMHSQGRPVECNSPAPWGDKLDFTEPNLWNNRCPRSFQWLAEQFNPLWSHSEIMTIQGALHGKFAPAEQFMDDLSHATMYADLKWWPSIYAPPRFWEAANAGTVNFLPRRTNDQTYFPHIEDGTHYWTFFEDFRTFIPDSVPMIWEVNKQPIADAAKDAFESWIRPGAYKISERLCRHIFSEIERVSS